MPCFRVCSQVPILLGSSQHPTQYATMREAMSRLRSNGFERSPRVLQSDRFITLQVRCPNHFQSINNLCGNCTSCSVDNILSLLAIISIWIMSLSKKQITIVLFSPLLWVLVHHSQCIKVAKWWIDVFLKNWPIRLCHSSITFTVCWMIGILRKKYWTICTKLGLKCYITQYHLLVRKTINILGLIFCFHLMRLTRSISWQWSVCKEENTKQLAYNIIF